MNSGAYVPAVSSATGHIPVRAMNYQLRYWGDPKAPLLIFLHGHRDGSATFQFVIDALTKDWRIVAPDWRGHGGTDWCPHGYSFQDYLADLDAIVDHVSPDSPVCIVGHSLGGNVANVYAGVRPHRVRRIASIDGFGLRPRDVRPTPDLLDEWLKSWRSEPLARVYPDHAAMAQRLIASNRRLSGDKALFLAEHTSRLVDGGYAWSFDPGHQRSFAMSYRVEDWAACWARIEAPTLWVAAGDRFERMDREGEGGFEWRFAHLRCGEWLQVAGTGHNIHHDKPSGVARIVEDFFAPSR
ncbi:MAG: alpha/beta fold hydrolase [Beijerinckiaceae bacterium]